MRDALALLRRRKWLIAGSYLGVLLLTSAYCFFWPPSYQADVHLLLKHDREDPVVSSDQNSIRPLVKPAVTEEDLNSEQDIIKSRAVLERTVADTAFDKIPEHWLLHLLNVPVVSFAEFYDSYHHQPHATSREAAIARLSAKLNVLAEKKSSILFVTLRASSPQQAKTLLETLVRNYIAQDLAVHRRANAGTVFAAEAERARHQLQDVERRMEDVSPGGTTGSLSLERDAVLKQVSDFESEWRKAAALSQQNQAKVGTEETELTQLPEHLVSEERTIPNQLAIGNLSTQLLSLQLRASELSDKYLPESRLVKQADAQRERAQNMLRAETEHPLHEETKALNQTFGTVQQNLLMDRAASNGSSALEKSMFLSYRQLSDRLDNVNRAVSELQALDRERRSLEEAYQLYRKRYEESRVEDQLNQSQVVNVSTLEPVYVEPGPVKPNIKVTVKVALAAGLLASLLFAFVADAYSNRVRSSQHLEALIGAPVFAALSACDLPLQMTPRQSRAVKCTGSI
ncbi:MAG TPA: Wzz/FepE/Etk N-terminal domain-containing protein [Bryobacteraceae bacterium]|jgi:uncharacterized protein involved in exopolysaccharide biosynthesis|nr:Wzz/FepE/Etk N-terminal domain-containing protein [Bryobacteraceae bacterium]